MKKESSCSRKGNQSQFAKGSIVNIIYIFIMLLKTRQQTQNRVTYTKPHVTKLRLHYNFQFSQKLEL